MTDLPDTLREIEEIPDMGITMPDGCRLSARVWRPVDAHLNPVPAILEYLPYRKRDGTAARDALTHPWMAKRGYACIRVDMRGNGDSQGLMQDEYTQTELDDAVSVIDWLASQGWCSGTVGMMGISWGGFNGLQVAAMAPEPLKAVITLCSTVDRFADDIHFKGGCLLNENLGWGATMWAYSSRAPDPEIVGDAWRDMWQARLENEPFLPSVWLRHQRRDDYWEHGSVCEDYTAIKAAVLAIGGWGDGYKNAVPQLVENLGAPAKGIIGPWVHKYPHFALPEPRIGFLQEALRWWDRWLKDLPNGAEGDPDYRAYLMDGFRPERFWAKRPGCWIAEHGGATAHVPKHRLFLTDSGLQPADAPLRHVVRSPQHCGMEGGEYYGASEGAEMPGDQRRDDALSACFDSAPLAEEVDIVGAPLVRLRLSADRKQAQLAVRLNHIHPDGTSTRITYGLLNLSHRGGSAAPQPLVPGREVDVAVQLDHIAYRLPAGHRLRVAVSTAYWPLIWPAPDVATLTLTSGALELPVRDTAGGNEWTFPPPESDMEWQVTTLREPTAKGRVEEDMTTGEIRLFIDTDHGLREDSDHGLISGSTKHERWTIHPDDPLSARGVCRWVEETGRGPWRLRTETSCEMWSDKTHFHLHARVRAFENDALVAERDMTDRIERDNL